MLVGVVGFMGSGKGTLGDILVERYEFNQDSWARPLKDCSSLIFGWPRHMVEGDTQESREFREIVDEFWSAELNDPSFTPRKALQLLGTESGRDVFGPTIWTSSLIKRWKDAGKPNTVITDCRFRNEIDCVQENGGIVVRVRRGPEPEWWNLVKSYNFDELSEEERNQVVKMRAQGVIPHVSETDWVGTNFDQIIENDGTLSEFHDKIHEFYRTKCQ